MGTKNNPAPFDCYARAEPDEPMFVLLARDPLAADLVRVWVARRSGAALSGRPYSEKEREALACADAMDEWRTAKERGDPYGPDSFAQSFRCQHGSTVASRDEYGCWSGHPCAACQAEAQRG